MDDYLHFPTPKPRAIGPSDAVDRELAQVLLDEGWRPIDHAPGRVEHNRRPPSLVTDELWNAMRAILAGQ